MESRMQLREHEPQVLDDLTARNISDSVEQLGMVLKPRLRQVVRTGQQVEVRNLVGSVGLQNGSVLEIEPKIRAGANWTKAVVQLLNETSRISVTGSQRSRHGSRLPDLTTAIAHEYARRLERALAAEGPIEVFDRRHLASRRLVGRLNVGKWVRHAPIDPTVFPVDHDELRVSNDFSRGLSLVAGIFRRSTLDANLSIRLRRLESGIIPGSPLPSHVDPAVARRKLPAQWSRYQPAWEIAAALLQNRSIIGDPGHSTGFEVAVEPWPLLETLLTCSLQALAKDPVLGFEIPPKTHYPLLSRAGRVEGVVVPDGILKQHHRMLATFEAKYTKASDAPKESHRYQALVTAAVLHAPLAVIVYPSSQPAKVYDVAGFNGHPRRLITVGLDMYGYNRVGGAESRAQTIAGLLASNTLI